MRETVDCSGNCLAVLLISANTSCYSCFGSGTPHPGFTGRCSEKMQSFNCCSPVQIQQQGSTSGLRENKCLKENIKNKRLKENMQKLLEILRMMMRLTSLLIKMTNSWESFPQSCSFKQFLAAGMENEKLLHQDFCQKYLQMKQCIFLYILLAAAIIVLILCFRLLCALATKWRARGKWGQSNCVVIV